jgi:4-hydroxy-tetrahydrodipicolinate reductase
MTIRVLVNGAQGKMGQAAVNALSENTDFTLAGATGRNDHLHAAICDAKADVVVDLTNAESVLKNAEIIIAAGARPVIGTSGLLKTQVEKLEQRCKELGLGGIIAPNFSIGAVLMMKFAGEFAAYFPHVEIIEMHHDGKLDSPSGTAIRTAEIIANTRHLSPEVKNIKETIPGARGASYKNIPIHAIRLPGLLAHQQIIFGDKGETLTIKHDTIDRQCFMPGVILACKKVMELNTLVYGLEHIL